MSRLLPTFWGASLDVDLGYGTYRGYNNGSTGLNIWKGVRYAAAPTGSRRWQAPAIPEPWEGTIPADEFGASCPQANPFMGPADAVFVPGDEDCLFLNVYSPEAASEENQLPVAVVIHGGGYNQWDATTDMTGFMAGNDNSFVTVTIQYRVSTKAVSTRILASTDSLITAVSSAHSGSCRRRRSKSAACSTRACWIRRLRCSGYRTTSPNSAATRRGLPLRGSRRGEGPFFSMLSRKTAVSGRSYSRMWVIRAPFGVVNLGIP